MIIFVKIKDKEFVIENAENYDEHSIIEKINEFYWSSLNLDIKYEFFVGRDNYIIKHRKLKAKNFKNISFIIKTFDHEYFLSNSFGSESFKDYFIDFFIKHVNEEKKNLEIMNDNEEALLDKKMNILWNSLNLKEKKNWFNIMSGIIEFSKN